MAVSSTSTYVYKDEAEIEELTVASLLNIQGDDSLLQLCEEYRFLAKHSVQRTYQLEFVKCEDPHCHHCNSSPIHAKKLLSFLREYGGGQAFTPIPSNLVPGHFFTWHEMATMAVSGTQQTPELDTGITTGLKGDRLCTAGCKKVFQSTADRDRHYRLIHTV